MAEVRPFRGLRYDPDRVGDLGRVLSPPYDVIDAEEEKKYGDAHPLNAVRVELTTASVGAEVDERYARAADLLTEWQRDGMLTRDEQLAYYLHECTFHLGEQVRTRRELIAAVGLEPWERRVVLPHEHTFPRAKADRLRLLRATRTNVSPILSFFRRDSSDDEVGKIWEWIADHPASADGADLDGVVHKLWVMSEPMLVDRVRRYFEGRPLYIADGHHRYETAIRYADEQGVAGSPESPAASVMMHLVAEDDPGLVIMPIHRMLAGLDGLDPLAVEERLSTDFHSEHFPVWEDAPPAQIDAFMSQLQSTGEAEQAVALVGPDPTLFTILTRRDRANLPASVAVDRHPSWRSLDVVLADAAIVQPLLAESGLQSEDAISYTRDPREAFAAVRRGDRQLAVLLNPARVDQVAEVALAGERMPEKSTYFFPKAPTGLVFRPLE